MKIKKIAPLIAALIIIVSALYFILSTIPFVRVWADDFCSSALLHREGFIGTQSYLWNAWTGRYSATLFTSIFELIGPWVVKILPIVLLTLLIVSARKIFSGKIIFAALFIILILVNSPNIVQTFYWQTGSLNYLAPFIFLNIFISLFLIKYKKIYMLPAFLLMLIAGGFSETFAVASFIFIFFANIGILSSGLNDKRKYLNLSIAGLIGILMSLVLVYIAPGNLVRSATVTKPESMSFVIGSTVWATKWFAMKLLTTKTFLSSIAVIFMSAFFLTEKYKLNSKKNIYLMILTIFTGTSVTAGVMGLGYYSMATIPPDRALFVVAYMILLCAFIFSVFFWNFITKFIKNRGISKLSLIFTVLLIIFSGLVSASICKNWLKTRNEIKSYSISWDKEIQNLPNIHNIKSVGGLDDFAGNGGWVASCIAEYYGYKNVTIGE